MRLHGYTYRLPTTPPLSSPANWAPFDLANAPRLSGVVALDLETLDPGIGYRAGSSWAIRDEGYVCGASVAWADGAIYLPIAHAAGNLEAAPVLRYLAALARDPAITLVMANSSYDTGWLGRYDVVPANAPLDVQGMATLLDEHRTSYSLDALARDYLGEAKAGAQLEQAALAIGIESPMSNMHRLPSWIVEPYAINDAVLTRRLYELFQPKIVEEGLERVLELERESSMVAVDMRRRGVRVDMDRAARIKREFILRRDAAIAAIREATGVAVSPWDNDAIIRALKIENPELVLEKTEKSGREGLRKSFVESLGTPVAKHASEMRRLSKAVDTFFDGYIEGHAVDGRIHAEFHPLRRTDDSGSGFGTISGRFSSASPNLQNIPARDPEINEAVRGCFIPEEGCDWVKLDYASQEPRLTVHFATLAKRTGAAEMAARFRDDPQTDLHGETAALMGVPRNTAKTINLGLAYGMGPAKLCRTLGLPTRTIEMYGRNVEVAGEEGELLLAKHSAAAPYLRALYDAAKGQAERRGYITTLSGRRARFPLDSRGARQWTHAAVNRLIQGSAADQMKMALVALRAEGFPVAITVHDEADLSLSKGDAGRLALVRIKEIMENVVKLVVPVIAESSAGPNWAEVK